MIFEFLSKLNISLMFITQSKSLSVSAKKRTAGKDYYRNQTRQTLKGFSYHEESTARVPMYKIQSKPHSFLKGEKTVVNNSSYIMYPSVTSESKWPQVIELYKMEMKMPDCVDEVIHPGISFYKALLNPKLFANVSLKINFPPTIMMDNEGSYQMIYTDRKGCVQNRILEKEEYFTEMKQYALDFSEQIRKGRKCQSAFDCTENANVPVLITKYSDDNDLKFNTEVETYKTFLEKKPKPSRNKVLQRYIISRNMKAMIFRHCFEKCERGEQKE